MLQSTARDKEQSMYNRIALTTIALALVWIAIQLTPIAQAGRDIIDVNIVKVGDRYIGQELPVDK